MILGSLLLACAMATTPSPRNIVIILADDMGLASLHAANPKSGLPTPNLDRLATQGVSFTDAHSGSAVCSPTRYGLLTGRYAWRTSMKQGIVPKWGLPMIDPERSTIARVAHRGGLHTACIGKWHLGWRWRDANGNATRRPEQIDWSQRVGGGPLEAGFDQYFGDDVPNWPPYAWFQDDRLLSEPTGHMELDDANGVRPGPMTPGWELDAVLPELTRRCVAYIRDRAEHDEPFLLYFAMTSPHTPINPSDAFQGASGVSRYADFLLETDWSVGEVLQALDQYGISDDTLVIFTTDNGTSPKCNFETLAAGGIDLRGQWRGHKADIWEGGHRVPFLVRWPGVTRPGTQCDQPISLTDIYATIADALRLETTAHEGEDSRSLVPLAKGATLFKPLHDSLVQHSSTGQFAVRQDEWKLCFCPGSGGWSSPRDAAASTADLPDVQLYNLAKDPGETKNLAKEYPDRVKAMTRLFRGVVEKSDNDGRVWWTQLPWPQDTEE